MSRIAEGVSYYTELVQSFSDKDLCAWMIAELEAIQRWLYKVSNGILHDYSDFTEFLQAGFIPNMFASIIKKE